MKFPKLTIYLLIALCSMLFAVHSANAAITLRPGINLGLVGYWSMNEGSGRKAGDFSGNGNDGFLIGGADWTKISQTTAGTIADSGTAAIDMAESMIVINGTLYLGTGETGKAEVYRYDGGTTWTLISQSGGTGQIDSGDTSAIDRAYSMANLNGTLYVGTAKSNEAEVYRYNGTPGDWTKVSQAIAGTIASGGTSAISRVQSLAVLDGTLYAGTYKADSAEVYRYDGGTSWTLVSQSGGTGQIASGGTTGIDYVNEMTVVNNVLYLGTMTGTGEGEVYRYNGGTSWTVLNSTAGQFIGADTAAIPGVQSLIGVDGTLHIGTYKPDATEVYRYDGGTSWTKVSYAAGQIVNGGTSSIDTARSLAYVDGILYLGVENTSGAGAEIYRYNGSIGDWTKVSAATTGQIVDSGTTLINSSYSFAVVQGVLYVGTWKSNGAEVYRYDGGPDWTDGKRGKALDFNGASDYVSIGNAGSGIKTVSFWVNADDLTTRKIMDFDGTDQIEIDGSSNIVATSFPGTTTIYIDGAVSSALTAGWHHVAITDTTGVNASAMDIGRVSTGYFDGQIDEVRVYNRALSSTEIASLYQSGAAKLLTPTNTGLVGYWSMDEGSGRKAGDFSGNGNDGSLRGGSDWTKVSQTTAGTIASGGTSLIKETRQLVNVNGTLYLGTAEPGKAEVYRYDGGTTWTLVSQSGGTGQIAAGGTSGIGTVNRMVNVNGTLYIGTSKTGAAEVYRYDGGTSWTLVSQSGGTGQIAAGGTSAIESVYAMTNVSGTLYIGTYKVGAAEIYRYDGGTSWTKVSYGTGQITDKGTPTTGIDYVISMANISGALYAGTGKGAAAEVYSYDGTPGNWTRVSYGAGQIVNGGTTSIDYIFDMATISGTLYIGVGSDSSEVYRYNGTAGDWTLISGTGTFGGTTSIQTVYSMDNVDGTLYVGTYKNLEAEVYRYNGTVGDWTRISYGAGQIVNGGTSSIYNAAELADVSGILYLGTKGDTDDKAEVYRYDGGPDWTDGKRGKALNFNGTSDYVSAGDIGSGIKAISFWINADDITTRKIIDIDGTDQIEVDGSSNIVATSFPGTTTIYVDGSVSAALSSGWHHVAITDTTGVNASAMDIGRVSTGYFDGSLDEVRVYNRVLTSTEVAALYNSSGKKAEINSSQNDRLTSGLVGLWSFNGPDVSGTNAFDRSGQGNNGTITGATPTIGKVGQALDFNGTSDYINLGSGLSTVQNVSQVSAAAWIKWNTLPGANAKGLVQFSINNSGTPTATSRFDLSSSSAGNNWSCGGRAPDSDGQDKVVSVGTFSVDFWYHVVCVVDYANDQALIYIDGTQISTTGTVAFTNTSTDNTTSASAAIGAEDDGSGGFPSATIDEVRVYDRALGVEEVQQLYNMGR